MVRVLFDPAFQKQFDKLGDLFLQGKVKKQIKRVINDPNAGKPMRHTRKNTREVRVLPFRLSYSFNPETNIIEFLEIYHKDEQ